VRAFVGLEYKWVLKLLVEQDEAAPLQLGGDQGLGWSTWLGAKKPDKSTEPVVGMVFEPEQYMSLVQKNKRARQASKAQSNPSIDSMAQGKQEYELENL
jgi:type VI secretion system protein ImpH